MSSLRILHVDDEPDIREIVKFSLGLDPEISVRDCASGTDALETAAAWLPDIILCDVMMPVMDGPETLARLRECPQTANIPLVFMTARVQARELEHFKSLGAAGVIAKPFNPMTLPNSVRGHLRPPGLATLKDGNVGRVAGNGSGAGHQANLSQAAPTVVTADAREPERPAQSARKAVTIHS